MNPNLFVAGVPKAGTTSLFRHLALHPDIHPSSPKEPGYFHPFKTKEQDSGLEAYLKCFSRHSGQKYAMEATPGYFYGGRKSADTINNFSPDSKVIIVLRDPVERLFSFYKYKQSLGHISDKLNFGDYIGECRKVPADQPIRKENYDYWAMVGGNYTSLLSDWYDVFNDRLRICFFDDLVKGKHDFVAEICKWLDLDPNLIIKKRTRVENKSMLYRSRGLQRVATSVDRTLSGVWYYLPWLKWPFRGIYNLLNAKAHTEIISDSLRGELEAYYKSDMDQTRIFLEERQIGNLPGWLTR